MRPSELQESRSSRRTLAEGLVLFVRVVFVFEVGKGGNRFEYVRPFLLVLGFALESVLLAHEVIEADGLVFEPFTAERLSLVCPKNSADVRESRVERAGFLSEQIDRLQIVRRNGF